MRFVFASDSLKGTISSARAADILEEEATRLLPGVSCTRLAVADGGEGTVDAVVASLGGSRIDATVEDPLGRPVETIYGMLPGNRAIIEMAAASGLPLLTHAERNPMLTSTYGTGQLVLHALRNGAAEVTLAIGGSATNDGGMGAMRALGVRFLDGAGGELQGTGADLGRVARIDISGLDPLVSRASFRLLCDVDNPLLGPRGATRVFSPQKGATPEQVEELERGMASYARVLERTLGRAADQPGDGAAGGLGAAIRLFLGATSVPGIDWVLDVVGLDRALLGADLCITGEGHADAQSAHGKVVSGVASRCKRLGVPCIAIVGGMDPGALDLMDLGVDALVPTVIDCGDVADALAHAERNYHLAAARVFSLMALGKGLPVT
ncbi:glycerate kinase family protein [Tractidigestivibacter montrealensis]|uniref:Glycerate kinase n=1 Tax=Tractidigestivibacter montrealensis TaxID=2972466 RepID=A0ABT1Z722_9ACTN|nr:glycerate kinase [Tractidigestivibacter montrealensis]MCR9036007.1 glycerate kinase [Tractidigestivibacter montrealensis]